MTDPRFDPAFQRGYSGPEPELVVRDQVRAEPVAQASMMPDDADALPAVAPPSRPAAAPAVEPAAAAPEPEQRTEPRFAIRNPYRLVLFLLGVALLIATMASLYSQVLHPQATSTTVDSQFVQVLTSNLPPVLGLAGCVCIIVWLALGALDHVTADAENGD